MTRRVPLVQSLALAMLFACIISGCQDGDGGQDDAAAATSEGISAPEPATGQAGSAEPVGIPGATGGTVDDAAAERFDVDTVPVSDVPLGAFPYFSIPDGHREDPLETQRLDFAQAAFWTGDRYEVIEGKVYATGIRLTPDSGRQFSSLQVVRDLEHVVMSAGGVKVTEGEVPREVREDETVESLMRQYDTEAQMLGP